MQPLELTLTGFKGIAAGMGLSTFTIDLREFADSKLVAIVGPNGRGKTTVLDNLQPFRLMPSKIKEANYSTSAFSFFDHLVSPGDASKDLIWEHQGKEYRTLIEWKLREKTQSTSAYLQVRGSAGAWMPVTLPDGTSSDGKAGTYDRCVEGILGSPRLYFTAAFSAQGRSQLSSYGQGDIKSLMSEVLGLHRIQQLGEKAAEVTKGLRTRLADKRAKLVELDSFKVQSAELRKIIDGQTIQLNDNYLPAIQRHGAAKDQEQIAVAEMQKGQQDAHELNVRRAAVAQQITDATTAHNQAVVAVIADINAGTIQHKQAMQRFDTEVDRINTSLNTVQQRKFRAEQLLSERDAIMAAVDSLAALRTALGEADAAVVQAQAQVSEAKTKKAEVAQLDQHIEHLVGTGKRIRASETDLINRCALTKEVPCQGTDLQGRCRLLGDAVAAETQLPAVREDLEAKRSAHTEAVEKRATLIAQSPPLAAAEASLMAAQTTQKAAAAAVTAAQMLAAKLNGLADAEASLADALDSLKAGATHLAEIDTQRTQATAAHETQKGVLQNRQGTIAAAHQTNLQRLNTELDRIPVPDSGEALKAAQQRLAAAVAAEQAARAEADKARGAIATAEGSLTVLQESIDAGAAITATMAHLDAEIVHWSSLQKALGRDGILALSIDDAGPTLAGLANDLLMSCYGPRFSVRIDTQETVKSTGAQKETFDVIVFDSKSDESKSVSAMSGGEKIWINEALTRAIALYQAQQSGQTFHTLFSDESDGVLDPEKKGQFVAMKRRVLELGGYGREFFISHSPDVWPLADAVIHL